MRTRITLPSLLLFVLFTACHQDNPVAPDNPPNLRTLSAAEARIASGNNDFAFSLFNKCADEGNAFISPLSVSMALGMVMNGASESTRQSILNTIDYGDLSAEEVNQGYKDLTELLHTMDNTVDMGIANSVWYTNQLTVASPFKNVIETYYDGRVQGLDFDDPNSADVINDWVADKTNDKIKDLIGEISSDQVMFLVNAIYFKGDWTSRFTKTQDAPFTLEDGIQVTTPTMHNENARVSLFSAESVQVIDIPYGNEQFSFTILLPQLTGSLDELQASLNADVLEDWVAQLHTTEKELYLPKFKMEWKKELLDILQEMGMNAADFPGLFEEQLPLEIGTVIHQTFIDVNEKGTEAAAATAIGIELTSQSQPIVVDRPFIFMIREKHSNTILFIGRLMDPTQQ